MHELRGRVPAAEVIAARRARPLEVRRERVRDPLKGYKGRARARLESFGVRVWSDVRVTNDAGSVFEGVILPRSETLDDEHVVIKLKTGYNVGLHVDRIRVDRRRSATRKPSTRSRRRSSRRGPTCRG